MKKISFGILEFWILLVVLSLAYGCTVINEGQEEPTPPAFPTFSPEDILKIDQYAHEPTPEATSSYDEFSYRHIEIGEIYFAIGDGNDLPYGCDDKINLYIFGLTTEMETYWWQEDTAMRRLSSTLLADSEGEMEITTLVNPCFEDDLTTIYFRFEERGIDEQLPPMGQIFTKPYFGDVEVTLSRSEVYSIEWVVPDEGNIGIDIDEGYRMNNCLPFSSAQVVANLFIPFIEDSQYELENIPVIVKEFDTVEFLFHHSFSVGNDRYSIYRSNECIADDASWHDVINLTEIASQNGQTILEERIYLED